MLANRASRTSAALAAALMGASLASAQVRYELVVPEVMGAPATFTQEHGNQINEQGQTLINRIASFAIWQAQGEPVLVSARADTSAELARVNAAAINRFGQVVGSRSLRVGNGIASKVPFYWDASNGLVDLSDLASASAGGLRQSYLSDLNDQGLAIGVDSVYEGDAIARHQGYLWSFQSGKHVIPALHSFGSYSVTSPRSVNNEGQVAGIYNRFTGSANSYIEQGFLYDPSNGARSLDQVAPAFFPANAPHTARSISDNGLLVGERGSLAYIFDLATGEGSPIPGFDASVISTRAYAVNERGVAAGYATLFREGAFVHAPILWTRQTGTVNLLDCVATQSSSYLPAGARPSDTIVTPKRINSRGQISARLEVKGGERYEREVILNPVLDFAWTRIEQTRLDGRDGVLYFYDKTLPLPAGVLPAEALGLEIEFLYSQDLINWSPVEDHADAQLLQDDEKIALFVPFSGSDFVSARFGPASVALF